MNYKIKNVSPNKNNIVIGTKTLKYNDTTTVGDLESIQALIDLNYIEVINPSTKTNFSEVIEVPIQPSEFIDNNLKSHLLESFFNYYLVKNVSKEDLDRLKWFYKNIGFTNSISQLTLQLLDSIESAEELTEVLLNNIYPELFDKYEIKRKNI